MGEAPPNYIDTPMMHETIRTNNLGSDYIEKLAQGTPVRRVGQSEDIAAACAFLVSDEAGYITGQTFGVNGGRVP